MRERLWDSREYHVIGAPRARHAAARQHSLPDEADELGLSHLRKAGVAVGVVPIENNALPVLALPSPAKVKKHVS